MVAIDSDETTQKHQRPEEAIGAQFVPSGLRGGRNEHFETLPTARGQMK
jgi:hypothetical protein